MAKNLLDAHLVPEDIGNCNLIKLFISESMLNNKKSMQTTDWMSIETFTPTCYSNKREQIHFVPDENTFAGWKNMLTIARNGFFVCGKPPHE